jgi:hypothetical protein
LKYGMPRIEAPRPRLRISDYARLKIALEAVDELIERIKASEEGHEQVDLSTEERRFYNAYKEHWVHAEERTTLTLYICRHSAKALRV